MSKVIMIQKVAVPEIPIPAGRPRAVVRKWVIGDVDIRVFVQYSNGDIAKFAVNLTGEVFHFMEKRTWRKLGR